MPNYSQFLQAIKSTVKPIDPPAKLSTTEKDNWNRFIEYVAKRNMANHPDLDKRDKQVGMGLIADYNKTNPTASVDPSIVPKVQQELQDYRSNLVKDYKSGKLSPQQDIKSEDEIMPGLSSVDGWPGTKTLSVKFPTAKSNVVKDGKAQVVNYGTNTSAFDRDNGLQKIGNK